MTPLPSFTPFLTTTPTETPEPTPTSLGGGLSQIAYASDHTGVPQIFVMNADGSDPRQVTNLTFGACQPAWSPDGQRLVFISPCLKRQDQYPDANLYIINADGSGLTGPLETGAEGNFDPSWSPDGTADRFHLPARWLAPDLCPEPGKQHGHPPDRVIQRCSPARLVDAASLVANRNTDRLHRSQPSHELPANLGDERCRPRSIISHPQGIRSMEFPP